MGGGKGARERARARGGRENNEEVHCRVGRPAENSSPASRARACARVPRSVVRRRFLARLPLPTQSVSGLAAEERNVIRSPSCEVDANPVGGGGMGKEGSEGDDSLSCELT